ncbi:MAG: ABC transporter permease subunit [bacterium]
MRQIITVAHVVWLEMIRRKDFYILFILLSALLIWLMIFDVFGLTTVSGYIKDLGLLAVWIMGWILALNTSIRQLPQEEQRGTLFPLLAKPISRLNIILGKWLGSWSITCLALLCFYITLWLGITIKEGRFDYATLCQGFLLHCAALAIVCAMGLALSTRMNRDAAATTAYVLTGTAFLMLPKIPSMLIHTQGVAGALLLGLYYLFPHFELFDIRHRLVHDWGCAPWLTVCEILLYAVLMTSVFLILAWLSYRNRRFTRENLT